MAPTTDQIADWVDAIISRGVNLTSWETDFIEDMQAKIEQWGPRAMFTPAQAEIIERVYADRVP
jgi:hypothetical protein